MGRSRSTMKLRRNEVIELLLVGSAAKLEMGMDQRALEMIERAYLLARTSPALPGPWIPLAAYRLAVLMLQGRSGAFDRERVMELLGAADVPAVLGPWPALYRLAAVSRDGGGPTSTASAFRRAQELIDGERGRSHRRVVGLLGPTAGTRAEALLDFFAASHGTVVQRRHRDHHGLGEGRGARWRIVGTGLGLYPPSLPEALAVCEFEALQARVEGGQQLFFGLPAHGTAWMCLQCGSPESTHPQGLRLLTRLLTEGPTASSVLREKVLGPEASDAAWEKARSRINRRLRAMLRWGRRTPIAVDGDGVIRLHPELQVLGLVDEGALDPSRRIRGRGVDVDGAVGFWERG